MATQIIMMISDELQQKVKDYQTWFQAEHGIKPKASEIARTALQRYMEKITPTNND
jgi:hypothetical protein